MSEELKKDEIVEKEVKIQEIKEQKSKIIPKIFMKKDERIVINVIGFHSSQTGELVLIIPKELQKEESVNNLFIKQEYEFKFSKVSYDKLNRYRNRSLEYNSQDKNNTINQLKLREYFLVYHLVDWNLKDENGKKIELKFDPNGALSDESLDLIYMLPSNLLDMVLATYEKRMNIF